MRDPQAMQLTSIVGASKRDLATRLAVQFSNFASRWSDSRNRPAIAMDSENDGLTSVALPPSYCCAMMLLNIKCLADAIGGNFQRGNTPRNCLDDCDIATTCSLCRHHAESLRCFGSFQTEEYFLAKRHRDMFRMTAGIAIRTSNALYEWAAAAKGLRPLTSQATDPHLSQSLEQKPEQAGNEPTKGPFSSFSTQLPMNADGHDFERLLEDILSTPILYT